MVLGTHSTFWLPRLRWCLCRVLAPASSETAGSTQSTPSTHEKSLQHSSSNIFKKEQQLLAVGLQTCSWKKALCVQGTHPRGLASIRFIGIFTFFICLLQKYQKHHFWNQEQTLSRSSDTCPTACDSAALPQELKHRVMTGGL